jgi:hypothetical protein
MAEHTEIDHTSTAALAGQSLANSAAIAVSDATTALRNVQAIMTTVQSVAMARWLASGERDEAFIQIVNAATQIERDAVRLWQEIQATAQTVIGVEGQGAVAAASTGTNPSPVAKPAARKQAKKKVARKAAKPAVAKRVSAAKKPTKPAAKKKAGKKAPAKRASKPRSKPAPAPAPAPPIDVVPTEES